MRSIALRLIFGLQNFQALSLSATVPRLGVTLNRASPRASVWVLSWTVWRALKSAQITIPPESVQACQSSLRSQGWRSPGRIYLGKVLVGAAPSLMVTASYSTVFKDMPSKLIPCWGMSSYAWREVQNCPSSAWGAEWYETHSDRRHSLSRAVASWRAMMSRCMFIWSYV